MQKAVDFLDNKKEVFFGMLAILATSILGYRLLKEYAQEKQKKKEEEEEKEKEKSTTSEIKRTLIPKEDLLAIIATIKAECKEDLIILRENFRKERRKVFENEEAYQREINEYNKRSNLIMEAVNEKVFKRFNVSNQNFDESVQALSHDDDEVLAAVSSLAKFEEEYN